MDDEQHGPARQQSPDAVAGGSPARRVRTWSAAAAVTAGVVAAATGGALVLNRPAPPAELAAPPAELAAEPSVALPAGPALPAACTVSSLPTGDAGSAGVSGGDPSGTYLVGATEPVAGGDFDVLVWKNGKLIADVEYKGPRVEMNDINGSGEAVGRTMAGIPQPYAYVGGKVRAMKGVGEPTAINDAGWIAGDTEHVDDEPRPQRWRSWDAAPEMMPLPAGVTGGYVYDITEDGTVLAALYSGSSRSSGETRRQAYLWHADGSLEAIEPPKLGTDQQVNVQPIAFRYGWVYAVAGKPDEADPVGPAGLSPQRYHPASRTWQKLGGEPWLVQVPAGGPGSLMHKPSVYVGTEVLSLPTVERYSDGAFMLESLSEDAAVIAGSDMSSVAADRPVVPLVWRCR